MSNELNDNNNNNSIIDNLETIDSTRQTVNAGVECAKTIAGKENMQKYGGKIIGSTTGTILGSILGSAIAVGAGLTLTPGFIVGAMALGIPGLIVGNTKDKKRLK